MRTFALPPTEHLSQAFDTFEVGVFDGHHALLGEQLFGVIVDQLSRRIERRDIVRSGDRSGHSPVDEHVAVVLKDLVDFVFHLFLFGQLQLGDLGD